MLSTGNFLKLCQNVALSLVQHHMMISKHEGLCGTLNKAYIFENGVYFDV